MSFGYATNEIWLPKVQADAWDKMSYKPVTVDDINKALDARITTLANIKAAATMRAIKEERKCPFCGFPNRVWMDYRWKCFSNFCTVITSIINIKYAERGYNG